MELFKPKGAAAKAGSGADDLQSNDVVKDLLDNFHNNLKEYNKNKDDILESKENINNSTSTIKDIKPLSTNQLLLTSAKKLI